MSGLALLTVCLATLATLFFSTMTYSLRDFSRAKLSDFLELRGKSRLLEPTLRQAGDLIFVTAMGRLFANVIVLLAMLRLFDQDGRSWFGHYALATTCTVVITLFCSVAIPHALAQHGPETAIGTFCGLLHMLRIVLLPLTKVMHFVDRTVVRMAGGVKTTEPDQIEQDILSVVEEGQKEGVVDQQEREMIESVIEFRDTQVGQIMTARPEIVALEATASLGQVKQTLEESGHSRVPVFTDTLDHIVGILYARDLLKHLGEPPEVFNIRTVVRPAVFVPEIKPLRDLLKEFRQQKVHIAIVADEYGGTAGLVTIEDILEELVGEISDEHEPHEPSMIKKLDDGSTEVDARIYINDLNRALELQLPEDAGFETLGGFISVTAGRIPSVGQTVEAGDARFTVIEAEPQKVIRVRFEKAPAVVVPYSSSR